MPLLTDGESHDITIDVVSADPDHTINSNWIISANLQIITGASSEPTTGTMLSYNVDPFAQYTDSLSPVQGGVEITTQATRKLRIESEVMCGDGSSKRVVWSQDLSFSATQWFLGDALIQVWHCSSSPRCRTHTAHHSILRGLLRRHLAPACRLTTDL